MTQPDTEQLLNLADRAERGPLTPDEAARLRDGINTLAQLLHDAQGDRDSWARDCREAEHQRDRYSAAWANASRRADNLRHVARSNKAHVAAIVPELEAAQVKLAAVREDRDRWRDQAKTEQADRRDAEAAIERVRAIAERWHNQLLPHSLYARDIRAALDGHQGQSAAGERHGVFDQHDDYRDQPAT